MLISVQLAYAIGVSEPVSINVNTYGTSDISPARFEEMVREVFCLKPSELVSSLDLLNPIYRKTAAYGHFGRDGFSWEKTDKASILREMAQ